jgi:hypothetical protein
MNRRDLFKSSLALSALTLGSRHAYASPGPAAAEFAKWPSAKTELVIATVKTFQTSPDISKLVAALTT